MDGLPQAMTSASAASPSPSGLWNTSLPSESLTTCMRRWNRAAGGKPGTSPFTVQRFSSIFSIGSCRGKFHCRGMAIVPPPRERYTPPMNSERVQVLSLGEMPDVERQLEPTFEVHRATGADIDGLVARHGPAIRAVTTRGRDRLDAALLARLPSVEIIANFGVGYDSIDLDAAARRGIVVTNTPDVLNDEVADFAVALLLATVRRLPQADRFVRAGRWLQGNFPLGPTLRDRTVGLFGMGRIGKRIAQRLSAFEVPIVYHSRTAKAESRWAMRL